MAFAREAPTMHFSPVTHAFALLESSEGRPVSLDDISRVTGVSAATLRKRIQMQSAIPLSRLLELHQLRETRTALLAADPARATIRQIAYQFGVRKFRSFERSYERLYDAAEWGQRKGYHRHPRRRNTHSGSGEGVCTASSSDCR